MSMRKAVVNTINQSNILSVGLQAAGGGVLTAVIDWRWAVAMVRSLAQFFLFIIPPLRAPFFWRVASIKLLLNRPVHTPF